MCKLVDASDARVEVMFFKLEREVDLLHPATTRRYPEIFIRVAISVGSS